MSAVRAPGRTREPREKGWLNVEADRLAVHVLTEDGIIQSANSFFSELFGTDRLKLVGKHQAVLNNHSVAANLRLLRDIRREIDSAGSWRGYLTNRDSRGGEFTSRAHIYPMRYSGRRRLVCFQQPVSLQGPHAAPCAPRHGSPRAGAACVGRGRAPALGGHGVGRSGEERR